MKMKLRYDANFKGYFPILRGVQLLLKNQPLTFIQLGAYVCFVAQADFDRRHKNYGIIIRDDETLAKEWGYSSTTVYRNRKQLIKKGLLTEKDGLTRVTNFHMFDLEWVKLFAKQELTTLQTLFTKPQEEVAKEEFFIAELQKRKPQDTVQSSSISSKGELGLLQEEIVDIDEVMNSIDNGKADGEQ